MAADATYVRRIQLRNYRSIGDCRARLGAFTLVVGPNGAGKSNFIDGLRFVADALAQGVEHALRDRGGVQEVRRRSRGHPRHFEVWLDLNLPGATDGVYGFRVGAEPNGGFRIQREVCQVLTPLGTPPLAEFEVIDGRVTSLSPLPKQVAPDRLLLPLASALAPFDEVYEGLAHMGFYNLNPDRMRELKDPDPGALLLRDGRNIAAVVRELQHHAPHVWARILDFLQGVVPGLTGVEARPLGPKETLEFSQRMAGDEHPWRFFAASMSDGTLRTLGVLVAALQPGRGVPLIGIEEPEIAIHPGAAVKLTEALLEASGQRQVLVTTHSPDLLDHPSIGPEAILAAEAEQGDTRVAPLDPALTAVVRDRLYSVGELLRMEQIRPDRQAAVPRQQRLFDGVVR